MVLYTVDGRQSGYSAGLGLDAVAERLRDLGCVTAGALDGGASTQMRAMLPGDAELSQIGRPSGLRTRSVANYIFLVSESHPPEDAARLALYPLDVDAVSGAEVPLTVKAVDAFLNPAPAPEAPEFAVSGDLGIVEDGVFRAGKAGEGAITVSAPGLAGASAALRVVESPEELLLYGEVYGRHTKSLTLEPGQEVDLTVRAFDNHVRLISQDENFLWELDEAAGTVDETGHLTPAMASGKGMLRVRAGETVTEIPITIWSGVPFGDVPVTHPSFDAIRYVYEHSLFNGTGETEFSPETEMNRAMLVTVLWRMLGEPEAETVPGFWDVDPAEWYGPAVAWGVERGILTGYSETLFGPLDPITGEQLFTILHRLSTAVTETVEGEATEEPPEEVSEEPPENIPDELPNEPELPETSPWARDAVAWALRPEYRLTDAEDLSALRDSATRAGVAEALFRYLTRAAAEAEERAVLS